MFRFHAICLCGIAALLWARSANGSVLDVYPAGQIQTLGSAIRLAHDGDTIRVNAGTYREYDIRVDKALTIEGEDFPTIDAGGQGQILEVVAPGVTIRGLHFTGVPTSYIKEHAAIRLNNVHDCRILDNRFTDNFFAVYAAKSHHCCIVGNQIIGSATILTAAGNGIHLWDCHDIAIENNLVRGHRDGVYLEFVTNSTITGNHSEQNLRYGLHFMYSDSCLYEHNAFIRNGAGVAVMYTHHVEMIDNDFQDSWGGASYGLLLKDIRFCRVTGNRFTANSIGIHIEGSDHIHIEHNRFVGNGWAIKIMANCLDDDIVNNDFIDNSFQVATNSRQTNSSFSGNYWSAYRGFDLDRDGYGDLPFRPVSLFSLLVESNPPTLVLLRSLLIGALDLAERILPTLTPEALIDAKPRMRPIG
jgi:nitrous oxidase accessory protein